MKWAIDLGGKSYVPLAAVPHVTGGFLGISDVAKMIFDPESYCDADHSTILSAKRVTGDGRLVAVPYAALQTLAEAGLLGLSPAPNGTTAGVVVPEQDLHTLFRSVLNELSDAGRLASSRQGPIWDLDASLPAAIIQEISESILQPLRRTVGRANSKHAKLARFLDVVDQIESTAIAQDVPFDRRNLPGRKRDFLRLVKHVASRAAIHLATFDKHYAKDSGLKWRQGSRPMDAAPLLALFGLTVDT